tara:strand:+ start:325 stop:495 length:171 start_codon:yes stop_codon:yes gene_type:complete
MSSGQKVNATMFYLRLTHVIENTANCTCEGEELGQLQDNLIEDYNAKLAKLAMQKA